MGKKFIISFFPNMINYEFVAAKQPFKSVPRFKENVTS